MKRILVWLAGGAVVAFTLGCADLEGMFGDGVVEDGEEGEDGDEGEDEGEGDEDDEGDEEDGGDDGDDAEDAEDDEDDEDDAKEDDGDRDPVRRPRPRHDPGKVRQNPDTKDKRRPR